jgi:hypothetical protein
MPTSLRHRAIMTLAMIVGAVVWGAAADVLRAPDGSAGVTLTSAQINFAAAVAIVILAGIPALLGAMIAAVTGRTTSGVFVLGVSLCGLAVAGGSTDGWMWRSALPGDYRWLIAEMMLWQALVVAAVVMIGRGAKMLCRVMPGLARWRVEPHRGIDLQWRRPDVNTVAAVVVCAAVATGIAWVLLRNAQNGQLIGGLIVAFAGGVLAARTVAPKANPVALLLSPMLAAAAAYGWVWLRFDHDAAVLTAWYAMSGPSIDGVTKLPGPALALPLHYASAGIVGCCLGLGMSAAADGESDNEQAHAATGMAGLIVAIRGAGESKDK